MIKVSFINTQSSPYKKVERFNNGAVTKVTLVGRIKGYECFPLPIIQWLSEKKGVSIPYNGPIIKVTGKAERHPNDEDDPILGERIAEARAKIAIYKIALQLCERLVSHYQKILYGKAIIPNYSGNGIVKDADKYARLIYREYEHLYKLLNL